MSDARPRAGAVLLTLSLIWFAVTLWSAHAYVSGALDPLFAVIDAARALPDVLAASMLAGAASALAALGWLPVRAALRWPAAIGSGTLVGALAAALILWGYGHRSSILTLAISALLAGAIGGAFGALKPREVPTAGVAATLAAFLTDQALHLFQNPLLNLFGAGDSAPTRLAAASRLALTTSLLGGLAAGLVAFWYLRRTGTGWRFPVYLAAGAVPGAFLLVTELVTRVGGAQVFGLIGNLSSADRTYVEYTGNSRLNHALILLFTGAIVAVLCFGRTLRPATPAPTPKSPTKVS
ncbi:MAG: hypothetical protein AUI14_02555 [Actinobacteria bacterium 13_2_20CM_2_71_6]|nr:MAG: hypothetical protein AUI14_02555 [Actinobacteria bacterium 13_2_20CM_2_71_6]